MRSYTLFPSPLGPITLVEESGFLTGVTFSPPPGDAILDDSSPLLQQTAAWLREYFAGTNPDPAKLPVKLQGTLFQQSVWAILTKIPYGQTVTYGSIARTLGPKMSSQAVGQAVGRNPIAIVIPCHRVLGAGGKLTGYTYGLSRKEFLLELEQGSTSAAGR